MDVVEAVVGTTSGGLGADDRDERDAAGSRSKKDIASTVRGV